jgi:hypothetical protein
VQEADDNGLHSLARQSPRRLAHLVEVKRLEHAPLVVEPLGHLEAEAAGHQGKRLLQMHVVEARADLAADLEDVAEAARRQHADPRRLALDDRVRRHRRGVDHGGHVAAVRLALGEAASERGHEALGRVLRGRQHFDHADGAGLAVDERGVGEGAADVDADAQRAHQARRARSAAVAAASSASVAGSTTTP